MVTVVIGRKSVRPWMSLLANRAAETPRLFDRLLAVRIGDAVLADDDFGVDAGLLDVAQHVEHASERAARRRRVPRDLDHDHVARARVMALLAGDHHVHDHLAVERHQEAHPRFIDFEAADDARRPALEDADDPPLGPIVAGPLDPRDDVVAVHRLVQIGAGDIDVTGHAFDRPIRDDEPEAARMRLDAPDHQVHAVRKTEPVAPRLNQVTGLDEAVQEAFQGGPLLARDLQSLHQFAGRRGMVDTVPDGGQQLLAVQHLVHSTFPNPRAGSSLYRPCDGHGARHRPGSGAGPPGAGG